MKKGLVLEGGGLRGIFTAGILDVLMEEGIEFDGAIGVSAGAAFGCNYKSKQPRRSIRYNLKYAKDYRYSSVRSLLSTGDLFGAQFCYHDIPEKLDPFDWETFRENPMEFYLTCTDVETGKPVYHLCGDESEWELLEWFRASGSMPMVSRVVEVGGYRLLDGGIADSIPLRFMEEQGYGRNLVILTRPAGYVKKATPMMPVIRRALRQYPEAVRAMEKRHIVYNETLAYVRSREAGRFAFVIRPERDLDIGRIEHDRFRIRSVYKEGRRTARRLLPAIRSFLAGAEAAIPAPVPAAEEIPTVEENSAAKAAPVEAAIPAPVPAAEEIPTVEENSAVKAAPEEAAIPAPVPAAEEIPTVEENSAVKAAPVEAAIPAPVPAVEEIPAVEKNSAAKAAPAEAAAPAPVPAAADEKKAPAAAIAAVPEPCETDALPSVPSARKRRRFWKPGELRALKQRIEEEGEKDPG